VLAASLEREYSRSHAEVTCLNDERLRLTNTSSSQEVIVRKDHDQILRPGDSTEVDLPCDLQFGSRIVEFADDNVQLGKTIFGMTELTPPMHPEAVKPEMSLFKVENESGIDKARLVDWLGSMLQVFQDSAGSQEFFDNAAKALVALLDLDHVAILFREGESNDPTARDALPENSEPDDSVTLAGWRSQTVIHRHPKNYGAWLPSRQIFDLVQREKKTVFHLPESRSDSLVSVTNLVASPLLDRVGNVIGAVYGDRMINPAQSLAPFSQTEAMFVELFASGISTGLARLEQERKLSEARSRFEQFFTPSLARKLEDDPGMLSGRRADISVLFCDIRGFSRIAERIGPEQTIQWINSMMGDLSNCIMQNAGVVVDYVGDEVMAMWGAPAQQDNHAELAVFAAIDILDSLPKINERWGEVVGEQIEIGIGINSGPAQVGNIGSEKKFKYGPLGHTVNVGSRVQGATKFFRAQLLVTEATANQLSGRFFKRRMRSVKFFNVQEPVTVYEVQSDPLSAWNDLKIEYESSLQLFENGELHAACKQLASIVNSFPDDVPAMLLLSHAVQALTAEEEYFDPVWRVDQK
jgi:adenylate cyclase